MYPLCYTVTDDFNSSSISQIDTFNSTDKKIRDQITKTFRLFTKENEASKPVESNTIDDEGLDKKFGRKMKVGCTYYISKLSNSCLNMLF